MSDEVNACFYKVFGISLDTPSDNSFCDDTEGSIHKYYIYIILCLGFVVSIVCFSRVCHV